MAQDVLTVTGLDALLAGLRHAPELVRSRSAKAVAVSTFATEQRVRALAPQDTGTLRRAIHSKASDLVGRVLIGPEAYYWRFVEFGTVRGSSSSGGQFRTTANPFVRTAAEFEAGPFLDRMTDVAQSLERDLASSRFL